MDMGMMKPKVTPKDFFLHLGTMIALYVSVVSLLALLFQYINVLFPDVLNTYNYYDPYSPQIRLSIASLIIIFPLYIFLTRLLNRDLRVHTEKKELWIRKWLIYITLFVGSITIVVDLITLINIFLGGEITTRFILKVLAILVVVGGTFLYYLYDLKGKWEREEGTSQIVGWVAGIFVLATIVSGFFIIGSPMSQRLVRFDDQKINNLSEIQSQIVWFWQQKKRLPKDLSELEDPLVGYTVPKDAQTDNAYVYKIKGNMIFELCATFNLPNDNKSVERAYPVYSDYSGGFVNATWEHEAGEKCFSRTIDPERFPPQKI